MSVVYTQTHIETEEYKEYVQKDERPEGNEQKFTWTI